MPWKTLRTSAAWAGVKFSKLLTLLSRSKVNLRFFSTSLNSSFSSSLAILIETAGIGSTGLFSPLSALFNFSDRELSVGGGRAVFRARLLELFVWVAIYIFKFNT